MTFVNRKTLLGTCAIVASLCANAGVNSWSDLNSPGTGGATYIEIHPTDPDIIFVGQRNQSQSTVSTHIFKTTNGGGSWQMVFTVPTPNDVIDIDIDPANPSTVYAVADSADVTGAMVYRSTNGGTDWEVKNFGLAQAVSGLVVDPVHPGTLYVRNGNGVYKSVNSGDSWALITSLFASEFAVDPANGNLLLGYMSLHRFASDGTFLSVASPPTPGPFTALAFQGTTGIVYAATRIQDGLYKSTDGGATWSRVVSKYIGLPSAPANGFSDIVALAVGSGPNPALMASIGTCGFYKSLDDGVTWSDANDGLAVLNASTRCFFSESRRIVSNPAVPNDFFASNFFAPQTARYTLDASLLPPLCLLRSDTKFFGTLGATFTLSTYCSPAATSYLWGDIGSSIQSSRDVGALQRTTYTVQGVNANGSSSVQSVRVYPPGTRPINISTRAQVLAGENVLIAGFAIDGPSEKTVVIRARGPSLVAQGVAGAISNPALRVASQFNQTLALNDDWQTAPNATDIQASGFAPSDSREAAVMMRLSPGLYTGVMTGTGGASGVGIIEVFEVDRPETYLVNISTRSLVQTGDDVMIAGFVVHGAVPVQVVVRARGPSLATFGITNPLADPTLELFSGQTSIAINDDWLTGTSAPQIQSLGYGPSNSKESAILVSLQPGIAYTAVVKGVGSTTGVGIVEVFAIP